MRKMELCENMKCIFTCYKINRWEQYKFVREGATEMPLKEIQFSKVSDRYKPREISINTE